MEAVQPRIPRLRWRRPVAFLIVIVIILVLWEGVKFLGGTPWRLPGQGPGDPIIWSPPFRWPFANDLNLPHVWNIAYVMGQPFQRGRRRHAVRVPRRARRSTPGARRSSGSCSAACWACCSRRCSCTAGSPSARSCPYVIASQTIPIIALAPLIVFALGQGVLAVVVIATYLTFFPVTIAMLRGLRSFDPRALELLRSYGASRREVYWKLRLPASMPYFFTALKIAATAAIVGAIIGEDTGAIQEGLGRVITTFNQYYATGPEKLWAAIFVAAVLGVVFFLLVRLAEMFVLRRRPGIDT